MKKNIEIKVRASDYTKQLEIAKTFSKADPVLVKQKDIFYKSNDGRLKLRIFEDGTGDLIFYKRENTKNSKQSNYEIYKTNNPEKLDAILRKSNTFIGEVVKDRFLIMYGQTRIHFDKVINLGEFIELEFVLKEDQDEQTGYETVNNIVKMLGINKGDYIDCAYIDLLTKSCINYSRPEKIIFENNAVLLKPIEINNLDGLYEASQYNTEIFYHMFFGPWMSKTELSVWIQDVISNTENFTFSVYSKRLKTIVGSCSLINIDLSNGSAEIASVWYSKVAQNSEINSNTIFLLLQYLFEKLKYRRVVWKCDNTNHVSKNAAIKLGFTYEGLFRKHMFIKNRSRDTAWYSIIDDDWVKVKDIINKRIHQKSCI